MVESESVCVARCATAAAQGGSRGVGIAALDWVNRRVVATTSAFLSFPAPSGAPDKIHAVVKISSKLTLQFRKTRHIFKEMSYPD